ncbi:Bcl-2-interacting killer [Bos mutus]|uniref:Bcl-2-interacting killer n=1 Tax=Bos mutus TaxID=72004 RepID=L8HQS1_9CETA|nr:Bcl-2-interacting killer [Bos mutus]
MELSEGSEAGQRDGRISHLQTMTHPGNPGGELGGRALLRSSKFTDQEPPVSVLVTVGAAAERFDLHPEIQRKMGFHRVCRRVSVGCRLRGEEMYQARPLSRNLFLYTFLQNHGPGFLDDQDSGLPGVTSILEFHPISPYSDSPHYLAMQLASIADEMELRLLLPQFVEPFWMTMYSLFFPYSHVGLRDVLRSFMAAFTNLRENRRLWSFLTLRDRGRGLNGRASCQLEVLTCRHLHPTGVAQPVARAGAVPAGGGDAQLGVPPPLTELLLLPAPSTAGVLFGLHELDHSLITSRCLKPAVRDTFLWAVSASYNWAICPPCVRSSRATCWGSSCPQGAEKLLGRGAGAGSQAPTLRAQPTPDLTQGSF